MRKAAVLGVLCGVLLAAPGCATYIHPERAAVPADQRGRADALMVALDILFTAGLGLIPDFAHGTIYVPKRDYAGPGAAEGASLEGGARPPGRADAHPK